jgi:hypothetical protein
MPAIRTPRRCVNFPWKCAGVITRAYRKQGPWQAPWGRRLQMRFKLFELLPGIAGNDNRQKIGNRCFCFDRDAAKLLKSLALPSGLRHLSQIKHLPKSGTPNHPMGSLCFIIRSVSLFSPSNTGHSVLGFSLEVGGCSFPQFRMPLRVQHP